MKNNKIGIITFHNSINYGVMLQAYALQFVINKLGYEPVIIDYNNFTENHNEKRNSLLWRILHFSDSIKAVKLFLFRRSQEAKKRKKKFEKFADTYFNLSDPVKEYNQLIQLEQNYDKFVCGSDQIWNPDYTKGNPAYFLQFTKRDKRISYAASFGVSEKISSFDKYIEEYSTYLKQFHAISVRESTGKKLVELLAGVSPEVVVDPTLLMSAEEWIKIADQRYFNEEKYVLFYMLGQDKRYIKLMDEVYRNWGISVVNIATNPTTVAYKNATHVYPGVEEFLALLANARCVVTDSFHGVAMSVNFRKTFYAVKREDTKNDLFSRINDFLVNIQLSERILLLNDISEFKLDIIDYVAADKFIKNWINKSIDFLGASLNK